MQDVIKIIYLANAGIMITYKDVKILVDAIQSENDYFSSLTSATRSDLFKGKHPFGNIDYMLYSHYHVDHIDFEGNWEYLKNHIPKQIILPYDPYHRAASFKEILQREGIDYLQPQVGLDQKEVFTFNKDQITLTCYRTAHDGGAKFKSIHHYTYLITIGGKNILVGADSPIMDCYLYQDLKNYKIDAALLNLLFVNSKKGREIIHDINTKQLIIYHLPFRDHPNRIYRNIAISDAQKYANELPLTTAFTEEMMEISI